MGRSSNPKPQAHTRTTRALRDLVLGALTHVALVALLLAIGPALLHVVAPRTFDAVVALALSGESTALGGGMLALLAVAPVALVQLPWTPRAQQAVVSETSSWLDALAPHDGTPRASRRARAYR